MRVIGGIHVVTVRRAWQRRRIWQVGILTLQYGNAHTQQAAKRLFLHAYDIVTGK